MRRLLPGLLRLALVVLILSSAEPASAFSLSLLLGPGSAGNGGSNPVGIPPGTTDIDITMAWDSGFQIDLSLVPGLLFGKRWTSGNWYVSLGGGILIDANGVGIGPYSTLGYMADWGFTAEYTQTLGISQLGFVAPGSGRIGYTFKF